MKPLISVIIPVYGVEPYLRRAVDSVLRQTYSNLEIILVDDGSPDGCPAICDAYAAKEARVRVIHKENGGLSDARNAGLDVAGGDYIAFLDSDDYYAPFFIEVLYKELLKNDAQVALCPYEVTDAMEPSQGPDFAARKKQYADGEVDCPVYDRGQMLLNQYDALCSDATYFIVAWNKLYKASLWKGVRYPKGKIHEDSYTTYKAYLLSDKVVYVNKHLYMYRQRSNSIMSSKWSRERLRDSVEQHEERLSLLTVMGIEITEDNKADYIATLRNCIRRALANGYIEEYELFKQKLNLIEEGKK